MISIQALLQYIYIYTYVHIFHRYTILLTIYQSEERKIE